MTNRPPPGPRAGSSAPPNDSAIPNDSGCTILHVDMDAFFASVEIRRRPELRGRAVIVGGEGNRGVVCSASYEAREFGVRSAMPIVTARRLCPHAVFLPLDGAAYRQASTAVMAIFRDVTPLVEPLSLDEAFLEVSGALRRLGSPRDIGARIRRAIAEQERLPCSVGIASSKFVAKLASERAKPNGMVVVPTDQTLEFVQSLPVGAFWGVGERTRASLERLGLRTVRDLAEYPVSGLRGVVGAAAAEHLHELAWARDPRRVQPDRPDKSIGAEETFGVDIASDEEINRELSRLAETVGRRLRSAGRAAKTVAIKVRFADFTTVTRSRTIPHPTNSTQRILDEAKRLFAGLNLHEPRIRLLGIRGENLAKSTSGEQLELAEPAQGWREADAAIDEIARKFGSDAIRRLSSG